MNLLRLAPKLTKIEKECIAWSVRNCVVNNVWNARLAHYTSYVEAAKSQELYFLDAQDVLVRVRQAYKDNRRLIKKLENHIKTCNDRSAYAGCMRILPNKR